MAKLELIDPKEAMVYAQTVFSDPVLLYAVKAILDKAPRVEVQPVVETEPIKRLCCTCKYAHLPPFNHPCNRCFTRRDHPDWEAPDG